MPPRARKAATPTPSPETDAVTIEIVKEDGAYNAWLVGALPLRFTFATNVNDLPARVAAMVGMMGRRGAFGVTWVGGDEAGSRAAKRLNAGTAAQSETEAP